ncbi:MAG: amylo-alpha-1,6-glucosidase [Armatimonadota bacterium]
MHNTPARPRLALLAIGAALSMCAPRVAHAQEEAPAVERFIGSAEQRRLLPQPVLGADRSLLALHWSAWDVASAHVGEGSAENGLVDLYMESGGSDSLSQWDTCMAMMYARYGHDVFPAVVSLDNFYRRQEPDGFICGELSAETGQGVLEKTNPSATQAPLFAWAELEHYRLTGDKGRLTRVLPLLDRYFQWLKANRRRPNGLYWGGALGSGAHDRPWAEAPHSRLDLSAQQALSARCMGEIAREVGDEGLAGKYEGEFADLRELINRLCWDAQDAFYYDLDGQGQPRRSKTAAGFWPLLAGIADKRKAASLVEHLLNPEEFWQPHLFPTLSAGHAAYDPAGAYWRGGVCPATNYAIIKGLQYVGEEDLAATAAGNHLANMADVLRRTDHLYEYYAPAMAAAGSGAGEGPSGGAGCGAIALLFENVIGLRVDAPTNSIRWRLRRTDRHGARNLRFGGNTVSLICDSRTFAEDTCRIALTCAEPFDLTVETTWTKVSKRIKRGKQVLEIKGKKPPRPAPETVGG